MNRVRDEFGKRMRLDTGERLNDDSPYCCCNNNPVETGICSCCGGVWSTRVTRITITGLSNDPTVVGCNTLLCGSLNLTFPADTYLHCQNGGVNFSTGLECGGESVLCDGSVDIGAYGSMVIKLENREFCVLIVNITMLNCFALQPVDFMEWRATLDVPSHFDCVDGVVVCNFSSAGDNSYCLEAGSTATVEFGVP